MYMSHTNILYETENLMESEDVALVSTDLSTLTNPITS